MLDGMAIKNSIKNIFAKIAALFLLAIIGAVGAPLTASAQSPEMVEVGEGEIVIETIDGDSVSSHLIAQIDEREDARAERSDSLSWSEHRSMSVSHAALRLEERSGVFATFDSAHPAPSDARAVIAAVVAEYDEILDTRGTPVEVEVSWIDLRTDQILGYARASKFYTNGQTFFPASLANALTGRDLDSSGPEINVVINAAFYDAGGLHASITQPPRFDQFDLATVVRHEIGHGLGFQGSALFDLDADTVRLHSTPLQYDRIVHLENGTSAIEAGDLSSAARGGDLHAKLSHSHSARLHTPEQWIAGTSYSHFAATGVTSESLMNHGLFPGSTKGIDAHTASLLDELGWKVNLPVADPVELAASYAPEAGLDVSWSWGGAVLAPDFWMVTVEVPGSPASTMYVETEGLTLPLDPAAGFTVSVAGVRAGSTSDAHTITSASTTTHVDPAPQSGLEAAPVVSRQSKTSMGAVIDPSALPCSDLAERFPEVTTDPDAALVGRLYVALLGRCPKADGLTYWTDRLRAGSSAQQIAEALTVGEEYQVRFGGADESSRAFVNRLFQNVLGREGASSGVAYWISVVDSGGDRPSIVLEFARSEEFVQRLGTTA